MRSAIGVNHLLGIFLDRQPMRCSDPELADDVTAGAQAQR
jgi:hypothetical protein